jgi:hypothetical protein
MCLGERRRDRLFEISVQSYRHSEYNTELVLYNVETETRPVKRFHSGERNYSNHISHLVSENQ